MRFEKIYIVLMLLLLIFCISTVTANEEGNVDSVSTIENSSVEMVVDQLDDSVLESDGDDSNLLSYDSQTTLSEDDDSSVLEDSDEIIVNDWDDLKYYCSLSDKNYNLKLKENTNYYPSNPNSEEDQIIVNNNVTITGSSGAYIGDDSPNARNISYMAIKVNDKSGIGVTIQGVSFKWIASAHQPDGVFFAMGGNVNNTIKDCTFSDITTYNGHSSILHIKYGDLYVTNCTFVNCTTDFGCISVYCPTDDARYLSTSARMTVRNSYFEDNYAKTEPGCINNCGLLKVYNTTFYKNSAFWWAGAIHTHGGGNTSIYDSNFTDNLAGWNGGALYTYSYLQIYNTVFIGNNCTTNNGGGAIGACKYQSAPHIHIENSLFEDNNNNCWSLDELSTSGTGRGGAISLMDEGDINVSNTTFIHNSASLGSAIAIIEGGLQYGSPNITLIGNTFINNTKRGDVLYIYVASSSSVIIRNNTFENSTVEISKFRISAEDPVGDDITINIDVSLLNPSAYDSDLLDKTKFDVYVDGVFLKTIVGTKFVHTFEDDEKHDIYITSSIFTGASNTISVSNKKEYIFVSKNYGNDNNNGTSRSSPVATIKKAVDLARNTGNIYIMDGTFSETKINVDYDLVIVADDNVIISNTVGNVFNITSSSVTIKNIQFSNLRQTANNGFIISANDLIVLENCRFVGGTYYHGIKSNEIRIYDSKFTGINVNYELINTNILKIDNISVANNKFTGNSMSNTLFTGESIVDWDLRNSIFENNSNLLTGALLLSGSSTSEVNIHNLTFDSNSISSSGITAYSSCLYFKGAINVHIDDSLFINNINSYYSRGAIIHNSGASIDISNSVMLNNSHGPSTTLFYASNAYLPKISVTNVWFGNSLDNWIPDLNSLINYNLWYVLNASTTLDKLGPGEKATITFDLNNVLSKTGDMFNYMFRHPYQCKLTLSVTNGILSSNEVTLINGIGQVEFTKIGLEDSYINISYLGGNIGISINGTKNTPYIGIETSNITAGDDLIINVHIPGNATGQCILNFNGNNYTLEFNDGVATKTFASLQAGNYSIKIIFAGDALYLSKTVNEFVTATKVESFMDIEANEHVPVGESLNIRVTVPNDATGNVTITMDNKTFTKVINDGEALFNLSDLKANSYDVIVSYSGDIKYIESKSTLHIEIYKYESTTSISAYLDDVMLGDDVLFEITVPEDATGYVTINNNGNLENISIHNGKAVYTISNIAKGDYLIKATYNGDLKYLGSEDFIEFSVAKLASTVEISVENIAYGQNATVIVTPISGATGNVVVRVDNKEYNGTIVGNNAIIVISGLSAGDKLITVEYAGDENYLYSSNSTKFNVSKTDPKFSVVANSAFVGGSVTVKFNIITDMTGNFLIYVGGESFTRSISRGSVSNLNLNNFKPGNYTVDVVYSGDNNYNSLSNSTVFRIFEYPIPQISNEGINKNMDKSPFEGLSNGKVLFAIDTDGKIGGSIVIDNAGNIYFASGSNLFAYDKNGNLIWKYSANDVEESLSGVTIGRNMLISPQPGNKLLFINITVGGVNVNSNMYQGSSLFSPIIDEKYNIYITSELQVGLDPAYNLVIIPYDIWETSITPISIGIGNSEPISAPVLVDENTVAVATVDGLSIIDIQNKKPISIINGISTKSAPVADQNGMIYAFKGDSIVCIIDQTIQWETKVNEGAGKYLSLDSDLGYLYSVNKNGILYKYDIADGEESLVYDFKDNVTSNVLIDNGGRLYLGTENGLFYCLDDTGNLFWKVNLNGKITGNPVIDEDGLIYVIVNDSKIIKLGNDELKQSNVNVTVNNIVYGDNLTVELDYGGEMTGIISLSVDETPVKTIKIGGEKVLGVSIPNISAGNHVLKITYSGDERFAQNNLNSNFSVAKRNLQFNISSCGNIHVGENAFIEIILPQGITGDAIVSVNGKNRTVTLKSEITRVNLGNLETGNYQINVKVVGNENISSCENTTQFEVLKVKSSEDESVISSSEASISLPNDATGTLTVKIDGKVYKIIDVVNGVASVSIPTLSSGNHVVQLSYSGDNKYDAIYKSMSLHVPVLKLAGKDVNMFYTGGTYYKVRLTSDGVGLAGKTVTFVVNGKKSTVKTDSKGYASVKINLPPKSAKYSVSASYSNLKTSNKVKVNSIVVAKKVNVKKSAKKLTIKVTLKKVNKKYLKSKKITLKFKGKKYTAKTNKKGVAKFKLNKKVIKKLKAGKKYTYQVTYLKNTVKKTVSVKK